MPRVVRARRPGRSARRAAAGHPRRRRRRRRPPSGRHVALARDREREMCAVAGVADRVLGEVLDDHPQHARAKRQVDVAVASAASSMPARAAALSSSATISSSTGSAFVRPRATTSFRSRARRGTGSRRSARRRARPRPAPARSARDVGARQVGRVEQREDPGERRPQLVRDGCREPGAELVERHVVAARALRLGHRSFDSARRALARRSVHQIVTIRHPKRAVHRTIVGMWRRS